MSDSCALSPRLPEALPLDLLVRTATALLDRRILPCVIGTFSLPEHLHPGLWSLLDTQDVDFLVGLDSSAEIDRVEQAMRELGLERPTGRSGKWLPPGGGNAAVDIIGRTLPRGCAEPACFPEPFANVAHLDRHRCTWISAALHHPACENVTVAGPLVTVLGKALKVSRYLKLKDWDSNSYRRERAKRAARDILLVIHERRQFFERPEVLDLASKARASGAPVFGSLVHGVDSLVGLFGLDDGVGFALAASCFDTGPWIDRDLISLLNRIRTDTIHAG